MQILSKLCIRSLQQWLLLSDISLKCCRVTLIKGEGKTNCASSTLNCCSNAPWRSFYLSQTSSINTVMNGRVLFKASGCLQYYTANDPYEFYLLLTNIHTRAGNTIYVRTLHRLPFVSHSFAQPNPNPNLTSVHCSSTLN